VKENALINTFFYLTFIDNKHSYILGKDGLPVITVSVNKTWNSILWTVLLSTQTNITHLTLHIYKPAIKKNHRRAWVEKDHKDHLVSTLCHQQGHQTPDQAAQNHHYFCPEIPLNPFLRSCGESELTSYSLTVTCLILKHECSETDQNMLILIKKTRVITGIFVLLGKLWEAAQAFISEHRFILWNLALFTSLCFPQEMNWITESLWLEKPSKNIQSTYHQYFPLNHIPR